MINLTADNDRLTARTDFLPLISAFFASVPIKDVLAELILALSVFLMLICLPN